MPKIMTVKVKGWTQTLEQSVTSAAGVDGGRRIYLDYPIESVTGIWDNDAGTGTNVWTYFKDGSPQAKSRVIKHFEKYILIPDGAIKETLLTAADDVWVTYNVWRGYMALSGSLTPDAEVVLPSSSSAGIEPQNFTGFTELTGPEDAVNDSLGCEIEPQSGGLYVTSVKMVTDGTNVNLYIYDSDTNSYATMLYQSEGINKMLIDDSEWLVPTDVTELFIGYQDVGANATPANTTVWVNGIPVV